MKTDRSTSRSTRATAAVSLASLLFLMAGHQAAGQIISFRFEKKKASLGVALALQVKQVQKRFAENRRALRIVPGPGGEPAYPLAEVAGLIDRTDEDLDQAIVRIGKELEPLRAWSAEELRRVREELAPSGPIAALPPARFVPRAVAVIASLGGSPLPRLARMNAEPRQSTIAAEKSNRLLDQVGEVVGRIFFLAEHDDLKVKLWVGSTPAPQVKFRFQPKGNFKGSASKPMIIKTNDKRDGVVRGLYSYRAEWPRGKVTELIEYPSPAGAPDAQPSEELDLVKGTGFFCCDFSGPYCREVAGEKECR